MAAAITRRPSPSMRSISAWARWLSPASQGTTLPAARAVAARPITAGAAPLTKQRTTGRPVVSAAEWKVAITL
jgi:hypothetical protein